MAVVVVGVILDGGAVVLGMRRRGGGLDFLPVDLNLFLRIVLLRDSGRLRGASLGSGCLRGGLRGGCPGRGGVDGSLLGLLLWLALVDALDATAEDEGLGIDKLDADIVTLEAGEIAVQHVGVGRLADVEAGGEGGDWARADVHVPGSAGLGGLGTPGLETLHWMAGGAGIVETAEETEEGVEAGLGRRLVAGRGGDVGVAEEGQHVGGVVEGWVGGLRRENGCWEFWS